MANQGRGGALAGGFIVNELNRRIAAASEQRKYLGRALTELLTIHMELIAGRHARRNMENIAKEKNVPPADFDASLEPYLKSRLKRIHELSQGNRFEEAITAVAGIKPVLADRLRRTQDFTGLVMDFVSQETDPAEDIGLSIVLFHWSRLEKEGLKAVESAIFDLAMSHGWRTLFQATGVLRRRNSLKSNPELAEITRTMFDKLKTSAKKSNRLKPESNPGKQ